MAKRLAGTVKGAWLAALLVVAPACDRTADRLPLLPELAYQNQASVSIFRQADARAREAPTAESVGKLGMLYHAYQFLLPARTCYELARGLAPEEFRWTYYQAKLEKTAFDYGASEALFLRALELAPEDPELWAEIGDLYLKWARRDDAERRLRKALELDSLQPVAALGAARLETLAENWQGVLDVMTPLLARYPRLSKAHQFVAAAHGALGDKVLSAHHQEEGEYGSAVESELMTALNELAVAAILKGDSSQGPDLLTSKCARCHNHERIYDHDQDRAWWARTVRRMQQEAGWQWLTDDEAAAVVAYLTDRGSMTNKMSWIAAALLLVRPDPGLTQTGPPPTGPPPTDIYLVEVTPSANGLRLGEAPRNITRRQGYDNQPAFLPNGEGVLFTSFQTDGQTDIMLYDLDSQTTRAVTRTPESEYSATPIPGSDAFSVIRVEKDERQRLWRFSLDGAGSSLVLPDVAPVGYHVWGDERTLLLFVLGEPPTLRLANAATGEATIVKNDPGRSLHKIPERDTMSFVDKSDATWWIRELHPRTRAVTPLIATLEGSEDHAWFSFLS